MSVSTFNEWQSKLGSMGAIEAENAKMGVILATQIHEGAAIREMLKTTL